MKTDAELLTALEARIANGERFIADYRGMKVEAIGLCFTCKRPRGSRHDCPRRNRHLRQDAAPEM